MTDFRFPHRIEKLRALIAELIKSDKTSDPPIDALIVSNLDNAKYLSGFTGSNALILLTGDAAIFFTDSRYDIQAAKEVPGFERVILAPGDIMGDAVAARLKKLGARRAGFESGHMTYGAYEALAKSIGNTAQLVPVKELVEKIRLVKDADEIAAVRAAIAIADSCFEYMRTTIKPGMTELAVAWEMELFMRGKGAQRLSFDSIVGAGPNSALIHGRPSERVLGSSGGPELLLCDFGCELNGYCSDITRTFVVGGEPTDRQRALYDIVAETLSVCLAAIKPGVAGKDIDRLSRDFLKQREQGDLQHGLGHSLGRVVHDGQVFSQRSDTILAPGMIATVEPGVYIEGFGGVRIEDDILITESGYEILTNSTKELVILR